MLKKLALATVATLALASPLMAAEGGHVEDFSFSFEGPFGAYDRMQLQRGLQVYTEVCSACHGMKFVPIRSLSDPGGPAMPEDQIRAYAAQMTITDAETGEDRPRTPADHFPPHQLPNAPDLSLMAKARAGFHGPYGLGINQIAKGIGGPEYIASLLTGYTGEEKVEAGTTFYENHTFPSGWIAMAPPLADGQVTFADGAPNDVRAMAQDVAAFLMWAAEPKMMQRKTAGWTAVIFLALLAVLLYLTNKRIWAPVKKAAKDAYKKV
ncbi:MULTISPECIES: cytochrome c1 [Haematobacter]|uniref:Cytochrome c1 n=1 Tax=Haematobacter genomosp. 1 TaxID=366618 RepID=A0A212AC25_9RHOB|nr:MULTISPECIES: cytochrome c1 [Haematobacter]OWJ78138.1 cytochrome c1 [Haematobacter genomosp. 1]